MLSTQRCFDNLISDYIIEYHYLHTCPWGTSLKLWCYIDGKRVGAMIWGHPCCRFYDQVKILELRRMFIEDGTVSFVESQFLGLARKYIREHFPQVTGLISYSSLGQGHKGIIYQADNWLRVGTVNGSPWQVRQATGYNQLNKDISDKIRWMRSP